MKTKMKMFCRKKMTRKTKVQQIIQTIKMQKMLIISQNLVEQMLLLTEIIMMMKAKVQK